MNNKNILFKSKVFCNIYIYIVGASKVKQGSFFLDELVRRFSKKKEMSAREVNQIAALAANAYAKYGFQVDEFFYYDVQCLSDYGKQKFITEAKTRWLYYDKLNNKINDRLFNNKAETYRIFKSFYKREILVCQSNCITEKDSFQRFINKYQDVIVKPVNSSGGKGIKGIMESLLNL